MALDTSKLTDCMPSLQRYAMSLTRNRDQAADLVQDSVERALVKAHLFDGANLNGWITTICRRIFLNGIRQNKTRGVWVPIDNAPPQRIAVAAAQEVRLNLVRVAAAFERLSVSERLVLSLVALEGKSYIEAAAILQLPVGTVRSRLSRARTKLAALVEAGPASAAPEPSAPSGRLQPGLR